MFGMKYRNPKADNFPYLKEDEEFIFPDPRLAESPGVVCIGANLSPGLLLSAYRQGIFPWFSELEPITWWSPDERFILPSKDVHIGATMKKVLRQQRFTFSLDKEFSNVMHECAKQKRPDQDGTWITQDMLDAYIHLHELGYAHSVEAYKDGILCGGLYGVSLGGMFFGESMFHTEANASRAAFITLALNLKDSGIELIDSQVYTDNMAAVGAFLVNRDEYLDRLALLLEKPTKKGSWKEQFPDFPYSKSYKELLGQ